MRVCIALIVLTCLLLAGCGAKNPLVGTWQAADGSVTFGFKSTGKVDVTTSGGSDTGTYRTEKGKLAISSDLWSSPEGDWQPYSISGDTLTLGEGQSALTFSRVQQ